MTKSLIEAPVPRQKEDPVGSLARGLAVLDALADAASPQTLAEISERSGFDASTAHRLLQILIARGYVVRERATKRYLLGPKGCVPLSLHHPLAELRREVAGALRGVHDRFGGAVALILFMFDERLIIEMIRGPESLSPFYETWLRSPLHASASGKVLLGSVPNEERKRLLGNEPYARFTAATATSWSELQRDLSRADEVGYAVAANDYIEGLTAVGAPIRWRDQQAIGCLSLVDRSKRFSELVVEEIGASLRDEATLFGRTTPSVRAAAQLLGR